MKERLGGCCEECGTDARLEFAHKNKNAITGMGRGSWRRIRDVLDNPENYRLLCKSCHHCFDNNIKV